MRILMVSYTMQEAAWTPYFARFFASRGDKLLLASFSPDKIEGINTVCIGSDDFDVTRCKHMYFTKIPRLRKLIGQFRPDIVFAIYLTSNGLTAALSCSCPLVVSAVGSDVLDRYKRKGLKKWFRESVIKLVARRAIIINTVSQQLDEELLRLGVPESKILQIPFGVDTGTFHPSSEMPRPVPVRLICTRKHTPIYDIPTIIDALALLKLKGYKFQCTFTSGGMQLEENKQKALQAGLDDCVTFTGFIDHDQLPQMLRQTDIYISASLGDGTSVSLLEAMASGLIPVVSDIVANRPWIKHGNTGLLFKPADPHNLAEMLEIAMTDKDIGINTLKENVARINNDCSMHANMQRLAEVFEGLILKNR